MIYSKIPPTALIGRVNTVDRIASWEASLWPVAETIATSYCREAAAAATARNALKSPKLPMSSGRYNRVRIGAAASVKRCPREAPPLSTTTFIANGKLRRNLAKRSTVSSFTSCIAHLTTSFRRSVSEDYIPTHVVLSRDGPTCQVHGV